MPTPNPVATAVANNQTRYGANFVAPTASAPYGSYLATPTPVTPAVPATPANPVAAVTIPGDNSGQNNTDIATLNSGVGNANPTDSERSSATAMFQGEIDAVNAMYATERAKNITEGQNRIGSVQANNFASGMAGSNFGTANNDNMVSKNNDVLSAEDAKHSADIAAVYGKISTEANTIAKNRYDAARGTADDAIKAIQNAPAQQDAFVNKTAQWMVDQGIDPSKVTPDQLKGYIDQINSANPRYKATAADLNTAYTAAAQAKAKTTADSVKSQADIDKINADIATGKRDAAKPIEVGGYIYKYDTTKNQWVNSGKAVSTAAPHGTTTTTGDITTDVNDYVSQFQQIMKSQGFRGVSPDDYNTAVADLQKKYGTAAVAKLNTAMNTMKLYLDNGASSDSKFIQ